MKFNFKAKDQEGNYKEGVINALSKEAAIATLQKNNLFPTFVGEEKYGDSFLKSFLKYYDKITDKEFVVFFRQLAILIEARVPIVLSLSAIKEQTINGYLKRIIGEITSDIEDGMPLSKAMERQKDVFPSLSISIIRAGETSGNLKKSIEYVAENIENNYNLNNRIKSALIYPAFVLIVFFIIGFLVITFVLPNISQIIKDINADVPWYTSAIMWLGDFFNKFWWAFILLLGGFLFGVFYYKQTEDGKKDWDLLKINMPIVGPVLRAVYISRMADNLGVLLSGGIPLVRSLVTVSSVVNNIFYEAIILKAAEEVKRGGSISSVFKRSSIIPPMVSHMVKIGEDSGQIDLVLKHISSFYSEEVRVKTQNLSALLEPVLMVIIGVAVGFMAFAVLMPIYNIAGQIQ